MTSPRSDAFQDAAAIHDGAPIEGAASLETVGEPPVSLRDEDVESESPTEKRERLEHQADYVRERLVSDVRELSYRTHSAVAQWQAISAAVKRHKVPLIGALAGMTACALLVYFKRRAGAERQERRRAFQQVAQALLGV